MANDPEPGSPYCGVSACFSLLLDPRLTPRNTKGNAWLDVALIGIRSISKQGNGTPALRLLVSSYLGGWLAEITSATGASMSRSSLREGCHSTSRKTSALPLPYPLLGAQSNTGIATSGDKARIGRECTSCLNLTLIIFYVNLFYLVLSLARVSDSVGALLSPIPFSTALVVIGWPPAR